MKNKFCFHSLFVTLALLAGISRAGAQGTAFTYQGRLNDGTNPANGSYDMRFYLYNAITNGSLIAGPVTNSATPVSNGLFIVALDFGNVFDGTILWLHIGVRTNGAVNYTSLSPRQQLTPTPYAITAENLDGTLPASQLTGTLPSSLLSGNYGGALTLNNAGDSFTGNGAGLNSLNASALASGIVPDSVLNPDVALLDRLQQTF